MRAPLKFAGERHQSSSQHAADTVNLDKIQERMATDAQTCRTCGILLLALSLTIVLPPVVIDLLRGGKALRIIGHILTGKEYGVGLDVLGPVLVIFFLPAIIAAILGVVLLLGTFDRRLCGKLLLWFVGFSIFMLVWPLLPIPWKAMGIEPTYALRLGEFSWTAMLGLTVMESGAVFLHVPMIILFWGLLLFVGWKLSAK